MNFSELGVPLVALVAGGTLLLLVAIATAFARFYRRAGADEALVRTGSGQPKVEIGGGIMVYPIVHKLMRVSLRSMKLSVERSGKNALVTADKIKANVTTELYVRVGGTREDVLQAARSFGDRTLTEESVGELIDGKLTDALRSVAANQTFMGLHAQRKEFAERIQQVLEEELKRNGLLLENVSITSFSMVPIDQLDPHDVFDSEGLRQIAQTVQENRQRTNEIERNAENKIQEQNVVARKRQLTQEEEQKQFEADQARRVSEHQATQRTAAAQAIYLKQREEEEAAQEKLRAVETARISQERAVAEADLDRQARIAVASAAKVKVEKEAQIATQKALQAAELAKQREIEAAEIEKQRVVQAAEVQRQKVLEAAQIDKQQTVETATIHKQIAVTQAEEAAARAAAAKSRAEAESEEAMQQIVTVEAVAKANREKAIATIQSELEAEQSRIAAEREAFRRKLEAETTATAQRSIAEGETAAKRAFAAAEVARAQAAADALRISATAEADQVKIAAEARAAAADQEASAMRTLAEAQLRRGQADAETRRLMTEAENAVGVKFLLRDVAVRLLDVLPDVTRELMSPAKAIGEIKVLQMNGAGATGDGASAGMFGTASPILRTILEAGAAYPLLRELMNFAKVDPARLGERAREALAQIPGELAGLVEREGGIDGVRATPDVTARATHGGRNGQGTLDAH